MTAALPRCRNVKWRVLRGEPQVLPDEHEERYAVIEGKLEGGDVFRIAEVVRDLAWRREEKRNLTRVGKRL